MFNILHLSVEEIFLFDFIHNNTNNTKDYKFTRLSSTKTIILIVKNVSI